MLATMTSKYYVLLRHNSILVQVQLDNFDVQVHPQSMIDLLCGSAQMQLDLFGVLRHCNMPRLTKPVQASL